MSKINVVIPPQAFELIRDRIADILIDEINNQVLLSYDTEIDANIYIERSIPFDKTEYPAINVSFTGGPFDNKNQLSVDGTYNYNIDVHTKSKSAEDTRGDQKCSIKLQKIIGICRAILENPVYRTLGFQPPFIARVFCSSIAIAEPGRLDALSTMMGRIVFTVRVPENVSLITPSLIDGYETKIKIAETDYGYFYAGGE